MSFDYKPWYEENKKRLSEKRKNRYAADAEFRERCLERSRKRAQAIAQPVTDGCTISFEAAPERIGITIGVLRDWRRKHYFPDPTGRSGRLWFTEDQITLLRKLKTSWYQIAFTSRHRKWERLKDLREFIYANWQGGS